MKRKDKGCDILKNLGIIALISGIIIIIVHALSEVFISGDISLWIKLAFLLIVVGSTIVLSKLFKDKQKERAEKNDSSKY